MIAERKPKPAPTPFARAGAAVAANGYKPIPVMPNSKSPGTCTFGAWKPMLEWQAWKDEPFGRFSLTVWGGWEDANIGVVLGNEVAPGWEVGALDFDTDDPTMLEMMESAVPPSPVKKRGGRGYTAFYLFPSGTKGRRFKRNLATLCEILTGNGTRQTVIPPSIHPDTGKPYEWLTRETLETLAASRLPRVSEEMLETFVDTVEHFADVREAAGPPYVSGEEGSPHNVLNTTALHNLSAWVPALGLPKLTPTTAGYKAIPPWRSNRNGWGDDKRNPALGFSANGIRDFSADEAHSPLDVVMLANRWDLDTAYEWLARQTGLWFDGMGDWPELEAAMGLATAPVDVAIVSTPVFPPPAVPHDPETGEIIGEEPEEQTDLTRVPGLLGAVIDWIVKTARQPNRTLALGAAITLIGTLMGRRIAGPTMSGTHLYIVALAPSGLGKDHALRQLKRLMGAANAPELVGPPSFMSQSAANDTLREQPCCACPMDEIGAFFGKLSDPRASVHEKGISSILRQAWGASFETLLLPKYSGRAAVEVHKPALSIYGVSTPEEFFAALRSRDVLNGFLNRFLMIMTDAVVKDREPEADRFVVPVKLRTALAAFRVAALQNTAKDTTDPLGDGPSRHLKWANDEASSEHQRLKDAVDIERQNEELSPFYGRTVEMAIRLATIVAAGRCDREVVTAEDLKWGGAVALLSARQMIGAAGEHMAASEFETNCNAVYRFLARRGGWVKHWEISKATRNLKPKDLEDALAGMISQRRIAAKKSQPKVGRPTDKPLYSALK